MRAPALILSLLLLTALACADKPAKKHCEKLLAHVVTLEVEAGGGKDLTPEMKADLDQQKKKVEEHIGKDFIDYCLAEMPKRKVKCSLRARNLEELSKCDES